MAKYNLLIETSEPLDIMLTEGDYIYIRGCEDEDNLYYPQSFELEAIVVERPVEL